MIYSETELTQIEKFASIYLKISDIAVILDIPADVLRNDIADRTTEVSKAYRRGKASSKVKLHSQEMMLAQVGSPLAIENAHRNLLDMEDDESNTKGRIYPTLRLVRIRRLAPKVSGVIDALMLLPMATMLRSKLSCALLT